MNRYYDNTVLESFRRCHRQYYLKHVKNWMPEVKSHNLIYGEAWHGAQDVIWSSAASDKKDAEILQLAFEEFSRIWAVYYPEYFNEKSFVDESEEEFFPKTPGRAMEMLSWYIKTKRKELATFSIIGIELPFIVPIPGDDELFYIGRNDKVVEKPDKRIYIYDHKTTKTEKKSWTNTFFPNNQIDGYNYSGLMTYGDKFWGVMIDGALCQKGTARNWVHPVYPIGIDFPQVSLMAATGHTESWLWETSYTIRLLESHLDMLGDCKVDDPILKTFDKNSPVACGYYSGCIYRDICSFTVNPNRLEEPPTGFKVEKWEPFKILDDGIVLAEGEE